MEGGWGGNEIEAAKKAEIRKAKFLAAREACVAQAWKRLWVLRLTMLFWDAEYSFFLDYEWGIATWKAHYKTVIYWIEILMGMVEKK